ncbi:MAG: phage protein Gp27 family protein [Sphaerochaetaceae bacterium]
MGRRSKADLLDLIERILDMHENQKLTIKDIEEQLREEGFDISRESIRRSLKSSRSVASKYKKAATEAKVLIDTVRDNPNTDVVEITTNLLTKQVFDFVQSIDSIDFDNPSDVIVAVNQLASAQTKIAKQRLTFQNGYNEAKRDIVLRLKTELKKHPEILEKIVDIVSNLGAKE